MPFWLSVAVAAVGLIIRRTLEEAPAFEQQVAADGVAKMPLAVLFREQWRDVLRVVVAAVIASVSTIFTVHALSYEVNTMGLERTPMLWVGVLANVAAVISIPLWGMLSDRIGRKPVFIGGSLGCAVLMFAYLWSIFAGSHPTAYYIWVAVSDEHTVVVDTGIAPERAARVEGLDYRCSPVEALAELGVDAKAVDHVVLTHLHYDHTGTAHEFPRARYVVQRAELDYWSGPWAERITRERWLLEDHDLARLRSAGEDGRLHMVDGDAVVVPGLSVHLVGGHTAGMQVVRVATASGHVVLASDASHFYENIESDRPFPILHSMTEMYGAFDRIRQLADDPGLVVAGHDRWCWNSSRTAPTSR